MSAKGRVNQVTDVVERHKPVKVKVISIIGTKMTLSMKEVDQETGEDLNPQNSKRLAQGIDFDAPGTSSSSGVARNPDRPMSGVGVPGAFEDDGLDAGERAALASASKKKAKEISDFEKWEIRQLQSAGAIALTDLPYFDEETGVLQRDDEEDDAEVEIELVEDECPFLKGVGRSSCAICRR